MAKIDWKHVGVSTFDHVHESADVFLDLCFAYTFVVELLKSFGGFIVNVACDCVSVEEFDRGRDLLLRDT